MQYVIRPTASRDIDEISDWLDEHGDAELALAFLADLEKTMELLAVQRQLGWPCRATLPSLRGVRTFRVSNRFDKILVFYLVMPHGIDVIRVLHGSRNLEEIFEGDDPG